MRRIPHDWSFRRNEVRADIAGRFWHRTENVSRTPRGLSIMAHRFARQVVAGEVQP